MFGRNRKRDVDGSSVEGEQPRTRLVQGKKGSLLTIFASGSAMFSDGYSNASMGPVMTILNILYPAYLTDRNRAALGAVVFAGMVLGQLSFGWISDKIGRKFSMFVCTGIIFVFSILCACSAGPNPQVIINCLIAFRCLLGIGLGGEYPSGSVTAAEATENHNINKKSQQRLFIWATNTMLDLAFTIAWFTALVLLWIFGESHLRAVWRGTLLLGAVPPLILLIARLWMEEPEAYKKNSMKHVAIPYGLILRRYWPRLAAVSFVWFLYNWIVYPFGMYATVITTKAAPNATIYETMGWGCLVNAFYVPGTIIGSFLSDILGPKYTMITGLLCQAIFGFALSGAYNQLVKQIAGFAVMYGIFIGFGELGPGNNLGLIASKGIGPTCTRGQLYGIAAAVGKCGAFVGTYSFPYIQEAFEGKSEYVSNTGIFWIGSSLSVLGAIVTFLFIPHFKEDNMIKEDALFREYLAEHGFDVSQLGEQGYVDPVTHEVVGEQPPTQVVTKVDDEYKEKI